jgi:hypothetical protein
VGVVLVVALAGAAVPLAEQADRVTATINVANNARIFLCFMLDFLPE